MKGSKAATVETHASWQPWQDNHPCLSTPNFLASYKDHLRKPDCIARNESLQQEEECGDAAAEATVGRCDAVSGGSQTPRQTETAALPVTFAGCALRYDDVLAICAMCRFNSIQAAGGDAFLPPSVKHAVHHCQS